MAVCQNLVPLVNIKIAGKWMFIPLKMVIIGIDPYPHVLTYLSSHNSPDNFPDISTAKMAQRLGELSDEVRTLTSQLKKDPNQERFPLP
jgi:hypothetical protein